MARVSDERIESAEFAAWQANRLGGIVLKFAEVLFWLQYAALLVGFVLVFLMSQSEDVTGQKSTDWNSVWLGWGALVGTWLLYCFGLALIGVIGALAQAKAESLEIQIEQARP
jgi:hypothetical protein